MLRGLATADADDLDQLFTLYMIRRRVDGLAVGGIGFFGLPDADGVAEVGYGLVPPARAGGLATEALQALSATAFAHGASAVIADTTVWNVASQHVLEKAGFCEERQDDGSISYRLAAEGMTSLG